MRAGLSWFQEIQVDTVDIDIWWRICLRTDLLREYLCRGIIRWEMEPVVDQGEEEEAGDI